MTNQSLQPDQELLQHLQKTDQQEILSLVQGKGWNVFIRIMEDKLVGLLSVTASDPNEAFAKVKTEEGFRQALDIIYRISSREVENETAMDQGRGERDFVRAGRDRNEGRRGRGQEDSGVKLRSAPNGYGGSSVTV